MKPLFKVGEQAVFKTGDQTRGQKAIHAIINKKAQAVLGVLHLLSSSKH